MSINRPPVSFSESYAKRRERRIQRGQRDDRHRPASPSAHPYAWVRPTGQEGLAMANVAAWRGAGCTAARSGPRPAAALTALALALSSLQAVGPSREPAPTSLAHAAPRLSDTAAITTVAPIWASLRTVAEPTPPAPPVTIAAALV